MSHISKLRITQKGTQDDIPYLHNYYYNTLLTYTVQFIMTNVNND